MHGDLTLSQMKKEWHGSLKAYVIGFFASLLLTTGSFLLVITNIVTGKHLAYALVALALVQAVVQLLFFLHVGQEAKPRWETIIFSFMFLILVIIAAGSLWVMDDLDERTMRQMDMTEMMKQ